MGCMVSPMAFSVVNILAASCYEYDLNLLTSTCEFKSDLNQVTPTFKLKCDLNPVTCTLE